MLERSLGVTLLERSNRNVQLTVEGQDVLSIVICKLGQHRIDSLEQMIERLAAEPSRKFSITGFPVAFCMWLTLGLCRADEAVWAQVRKLFNWRHFESNAREALCCW